MAIIIALKKKSDEYILFDCLNEYFLREFEIIFLPRKKECRLKNFNVTILDKDKKVVNIFHFINNDIELISNTFELRAKGRYLKFDLINNYGGDYIIIKKLTLEVCSIDIIE